MNRRGFIHDSLHTIAGAGLFSTMGAYGKSSKNLNSLLSLNPNNDHVLVIIFLNGGNDGLNSVVPLNQLSILNQLRPHVALPDSSLLPLNGTDLAFHPSMSGMRNLYHDGKLKVVRAVGYQDQNFSHFRSTDIWMSGSDSREVLNSGWMGRYINEDYPGYPGAYPTNAMPDPLAVEIGYGNSLLFQGPLSNMAVVLNGERAFYELFSDDVNDVPDTNYGEKLAHVKLIRRQSQVYGEVVRDAAAKIHQQRPYPETDLAQQLRIVARLIAGGLRTPVYKVEIGGFDTHGGQVEPGNTTSGVHANLLTQLSDAIVAFMDDLEFLGVQDRVMGMTFSEFGRRIVSNASNGTDHGSAGPMFVFGNHVQTGVLGSHYTLDRQMDFTDNLDFQYDFRQVYASMLEQWLCVPSDRIRDALSRNYQSLPIVNASACDMSTPTLDFVPERDFLKVYPNPVVDYLNIEFNDVAEHIHVHLIGQDGRLIKNLAAGKLSTSSLNVNVSHLPPGQYFIQVYTRRKKSRSAFIKI